MDLRDPLAIQGYQICSVVSDEACNDRLKEGWELVAVVEADLLVARYGFTYIMRKKVSL